MKQTTALILSLVILLSTAAFAISVGAQENGSDDIFNDVYSDDWFLPDLKTVYDAGLLRGKGNGVFDPDAFVTIAEISAVAARLHAFYAGTVPVFEKTSPWHKAYFDYCSEHGIFVPVHGDPSDQITREEFCAVIARILPEDVFSDTSTIVDGAIADVPADGQYAQDVYAICRSGILQCYKTTFEFFPTLRINRYDLSATLARILDPTLRISYSVDTLNHLTGQKLTDLNSGIPLSRVTWLATRVVSDDYHMGDGARVGDLCAYQYCRIRPDSFMHSGVIQYGDFERTYLSVPRKTLYNTAAFLFGNEVLDQSDEEMFKFIPDYDEAADRYIFPLNTDYVYFGNAALMESEIVSESDVAVVNAKLYIYTTSEGRWYNYSFRKVTDPGTGIQYYQLLSVELDETKPILTDYHPENVY